MGGAGGAAALGHIGGPVSLRVLYQYFCPFFYVFIF